MDIAKIRHQVSSIVKNTIEYQDHIICNAVKENLASGWDSLDHAFIVYRVQRKFGLKWDTKQVMSIQGIDDICNLIWQELQSGKSNA